jgi:hypothetical protein
MWWDDGFEQNVYVVGLGTTLATNVKFTGQATIAPGYYAGYVLHLEAIDSDSLTIDQARSSGDCAQGPRGPALPGDHGPLSPCPVTLVLEERPHGQGRSADAGLG